MSQVRQYVVVTALAVLVLMAAGWFLLISPQRSEAAAIRTEAESQESANAGLRTQLAALQKQAEDLPAQEARLAEFAVQVPTDPALPTLIRQLTAAAETSGVNLKAVAPGAPALASTTAATGSAAGTSAAAAASAASAQLAYLPLTVDIDGTFYQLSAFLRELELLQRVFLVEGFTVGAGTDAASGPADTTPAEVGPLTISITGRVFVLVDAPAPAASATTPSTEAQSTEESAP